MQASRAFSRVANFARASGHGAGGHADAHATTVQWKKLTAIGAVPVSLLLSAIFFGGYGIHEEKHEKATYPYMQIRNKAFPWGERDLFDNTWKDIEGEH